MNEYISNLQEETKKAMENTKFNAKKKNQNEIKKVILISLGLDEKILENPRTFQKLSAQMDNQLYSLGLKQRKNEAIDSKEVENIIHILTRQGWRNVYKVGFVVPANSNSYRKGIKQTQKKGTVTKYKKETRYIANSKAGHYIDIDDVTILRINPNSENETIIVGNIRTGIDERGVEVSKIDSRAEYNSTNAFNLNDFHNPTEEAIMKHIEQMSSEGNSPIKSYNGFLKGKCLIFRRYFGENEGAGKLICHIANETSRIHTEPKSIDLTRMEGDIAKLDEISLRNLEELEDYVCDPYNRKENGYRRKRLEEKKQESTIFKSLYKEQR